MPHAPLLCGGVLFGLGVGNGPRPRAHTTTRPLAHGGEARHPWTMLGGAPLVTTLKYLVLAACSACWIYAAYHGTIFEGQLRTRDYRQVEAINRPGMLFSRKLSDRAQAARRKVFIALTIFAILALCLAVILFFDASDPTKSPFLFHAKLG
jgi:hypothetical protein